jgi:hypothetical protein
MTAALPIPADRPASSDLAHRQFLGRHLVPFRTKRTSLPLVENRQRRGALFHPAWLITITGLGDHDRPESVITIDRNAHCRPRFSGSLRGSACPCPNLEISARATSAG